MEEKLMNFSSLKAGVSQVHMRPTGEDSILPALSRANIKRFNKPDTYIIISDYPERSSRGQKNYGIAWYTKELIEPLAKNYNTRFVVLAEKGYDNRPKLYANGRILVLRVFKQKHNSLFPTILTYLWKFNKVQNIHVHSEFCANGGLKNMVLLLPFLALIKLNRKNVTYFSHNVITTLSDIATHLNMNKNSLKYMVFNGGISYYYKTLGFVVDRFVVMDTAIKNRLMNFIPESKIILSPFWTPEHAKPIPKSKAKKKLGIKQDEFVLLYFGFITHYKGADWLIKTVQELRKQKKFQNVRLILAGGEAYSLKEKAYYQRYYHNLLESLKNETSIQITGFVAEQEIGTYFQASDLTVFPYRGLIGGSGALMHALSYKKPFIVSQKMDEILKSKEIQAAFEENNIQQKDITFLHSKESFQKLLSQSMKKSYLKRLKLAAVRIAQARSKDLLISACYNKLYAASNLPLKKVQVAFGGGKNA